MCERDGFDRLVQNRSWGRPELPLRGAMNVWRCHLAGEAFIYVIGKYDATSWM